MQTTHVVKEAALMPHESPLLRVHSLGRDEGSLSLNELTVLCTSLSKKVESLKVKTLEQTIKTSQARRRAKVMISDAEDDKEDSSKQGRSLIEELDMDARISLVPPHVADQGRFDDTQNILARVTADNDFVQQLQAGEKVSDEDLPRKLVELVNQRKKFFAQQRAKAKRNKPMTPAQQKEVSSRETGKEPKAEELSQEQLHQMMMVILVEEVYVEALQKFNRDELDKLWNLVKERFRTTKPTKDKANELWVELKRLFGPDENDTLWKLHIYMHDPLNWWLYDTCGVHHVSTERGHDIYMLVEKDYPLTKALMTLMLCNKLRVDQYFDMAEELLKKIFILLERPRQ
ncbi:hypothetical protein Tco_1008646 [Tanacetum coccineum]